MEQNRCIFCMYELESESRRCPNCKKAVWEYQWNRRWLRPYTVLKNRYMIGAVLGEGASGITYLAYDMKEQSAAAVKEYFPVGKVFREEGTQTVYVSDADKTEAFISGLGQYKAEAERLAGKRHIDGLVEEKDYFTDNQTGYIVMEYLSGRSLKEYLRQSHQIQPETASKILLPVMRAVLSLHGEGMVHCDISPDNLLFDKNNNLKIIDLGSARRIGEIDGSKELKEGYAPPEQYTEKENIGPWTDVYAVCAVWYEMVTERKVPSATERLKKDLLKPLSEYTRVQKGQEQAILQGLSLEIQKRYFSVENLMTRLGLSYEGMESCCEAIRKEWGGLWIQLTTRVGRNTGKAAGSGRARRCLKRMAAVCLCMVIIASLMVGGVWVYCRKYPEKAVEYYLKRDKKEAAGHIGVIREDMDFPEYKEDMDFVKKNASSVNNESAVSIQYDMTEKTAKEWGKVSNSVQRFYLKESTMKKVLDMWMAPETAKEGAVSFQGSVQVRRAGRKAMKVSFLKTKTYVYDQMEVMVESDLNSCRVTEITLKGPYKGMEESVSGLLPMISPESLLTETDVREIMEQADASSTHSIEFLINAKCRIYVTREGMGENGERSYRISLCAG